MYIAFPVLLYTGERIFRAFRSGSYEVDILKVFDQLFPFSTNFVKSVGLKFCKKFMVQPKIWKFSISFIVFVNDNNNVILPSFFPCRLVSIQGKFCTSKCKNQKVSSSTVACIYSSSALKFRLSNGTFISFKWQFHSRYFAIFILTKTVWTNFPLNT